jgi:hypothetical protein
MTARIFTGLLITLLIAAVTQGAVYTRWGKTSCPGGRSMVYNGVMVGTDWRKYGGGSEYLCLPNDPQYGTYIVGSQGYATLVPTEYELTVAHASSQYNAPCALCKTTRQDTVMIPARTTCYPGWTLEYQGYLMTEGQNYNHSTRFVCVDKNYDVVWGSEGNHHPSTHLYHVEVDCSTGIISCNIYKHNNYKEVTCVVCSI